ncbi:MAG: hypothetical protein HYX56_00230 [Chloroflexi bacterium]|nr:hypothetical protein [Chloroflexota bacterium]
MSDEVTELPLPFDVTPMERETARRLIAKHTKITGEDQHTVRFEGHAVGQTGPVWHFQYLRMFKIPTGWLIAGHDLREGMKVGYAARPEDLAKSFDHPAVQEFVADELRFRGVIGSEHAGG